MEKKAARNTGLDLLRMVSMLMVAVLHILGQGGVMVRTGGNDPTYFTCYFLEAACLCAANGYALLSGYVGVKSHFSARKLLGMILTVEFYSLVIGLILGLSHRDWMTGETWLQIILPIQWKTWWYYSAYVGLYFLMPFLNRGVKALEPRDRRNLLSVTFMLFSVCTMIAKVFFADPFSLVGGYSLIWLVILYVFGACLRELEEERGASSGSEAPSPDANKASALQEKTKGFWERILDLRPGALLLIFAGSTVLSWLWKVLVDTGVITAPADTQLQRMLLIYHSPTIVINAIALLLLFRQLRIRSTAVSRIITLLAPSAFYVYIMHTHPLIWEHILKGAFSAWRTLPPAVVIFPVLGAALGIYLVCSAIDLVRRMICRLFIGKTGTGRKA